MAGNRNLGHHARILLEVLAATDIGLAPRELARNFDADLMRAEATFEELADEGLVEHLGDDVYRLSQAGEEMIREPVRGSRAVAGVIDG